MTMTQTEIKALAAEIVNSMENIGHQERQEEWDQWEGQAYEAQSERLDAIRAEIESAHAALAEAQHRAKHVPVMTQVLDLLDGSITHIVRPKSQILIQTIEDALVQKTDRHQHSLRLLSLIWSPKEGIAKPQWRINQYHDGSGIDEQAFVCRSLEEAQDIVRDMFTADVALWERAGKEEISRSDQAKVKSLPYQWKPYRDSGAMLPESWPPELLKRLNSKQMDAHDAEVARAVETLSKAKGKKPAPFLDLSPEEPF